MRFLRENNCGTLSFSLPLILIGVKQKTYQIFGLTTFAAQTGRHVVAISSGRGFLKQATAKTL